MTRTWCRIVLLNNGLLDLSPPQPAHSNRPLLLMALIRSPRSFWTGPCNALFPPNSLWLHDLTSGSLTVLFIVGSLSPYRWNMLLGVRIKHSHFRSKLHLFHSFLLITSDSLLKGRCIFSFQVFLSDTYFIIYGFHNVWKSMKNKFFNEMKTIYLYPLLEPHL